MSTDSNATFFANAQPSVCDPLMIQPGCFMSVSGQRGVSTVAAIAELHQDARRNGGQITTIDGFGRCMSEYDPRPYEPPPPPVPWPKPEPPVYPTLGMICLAALLSPSLSGQAADPSAALRAHLDRNLPKELIQERPPLAVGVFMVGMHAVRGNLVELRVDRDANEVRASLKDGKDVRWTCTSSFEKRELRKSPQFDTQCTLTQTGLEPQTFIVDTRQKGGRTAASASPGSRPGTEPVLFLGTELPSAIPDWVPTPAPEYVQDVLQAVFMPGALGRYLFDSPHSASVLKKHVEESLRARSFFSIPQADGSIMGLSESGNLLRLVRFSATDLGGGRSRCDLSFMQGDK